MWLQLWSLQRLGHVGLTRSPDRLITARSLLFMLTSQIIWLKSAGEAKAQWDVTFLNRGVNTPILEVILWAITEKISLFTLRAEIVLNILISKSPSTAAWNSSQLLSCEIKCSHLDVYSETSIIFWEGSGYSVPYLYILISVWNTLSWGRCWLRFVLQLLAMFVYVCLLCPSSHLSETNSLPTRDGYYSLLEYIFLLKIKNIQNNLHYFKMKVTWNKIK